GSRIFRPSRDGPRCTWHRLRIRNREFAFPLREVTPRGGAGDGRELFYLGNDGKLMAASVDGRGPTFKVGAVQPLFDVRPSGGRYTYDVTADGQRFLVSTQPAEARPGTTPITVVVNWTADLNK